MRQKVQEYKFREAVVRNRLTVYDGHGVLYIKRLTGENRARVKLFHKDILTIIEIVEELDRLLNSADLVDKKIGKYEEVLEPRNFIGQECCFSVNLISGLDNQVFVYLSWDKRDESPNGNKEDKGTLCLKWKEILLFYFNKEKQQ